VHSEALELPRIDSAEQPATLAEAWLGLARAHLRELAGLRVR
jgi:hypothetical protein